MGKITEIDAKSVQATMLIPLWGRAEYTKFNPDILDDQTAIQERQKEIYHANESR